MSLGNATKRPWTIRWFSVASILAGDVLSDAATPTKMPPRTNAAFNVLRMWASHGNALHADNRVARTKRL